MIIQIDTSLSNIRDSEKKRVVEMIKSSSPKEIIIESEEIANILLNDYLLTIDNFTLLSDYMKMVRENDKKYKKSDIILIRSKQKVSTIIDRSIIKDVDKTFFVTSDEKTKKSKKVTIENIKLEPKVVIIDKYFKPVLYYDKEIFDKKPIVVFHDEPIEDVKLKYMFFTSGALFIINLKKYKVKKTSSHGLSGNLNQFNYKNSSIISGVVNPFDVIISNDGLPILASIGHAKMLIGSGLKIPFSVDEPVMVKINGKKHVIINDILYSLE